MLIGHKGGIDSRWKESLLSGPYDKYSPNWSDFPVNDALDRNVFHLLRRADPDNP